MGENYGRTESKKPEKVNITLTSDNIYARSEIKDGAGYLTEASLSPDGERLVVTAAEKCSTCRLKRE